VNIYFNRNFSSIELLFKEIKKYNKKVNLFYTRSTVNIKSKYAKVFKEPKNLNEYLDFCSKHKIDYFYPWKNIEIFYGNELLFKEIGVKILLPTSSIKNYNLIDDKSKFYKYINSFLPELIPEFRTIKKLKDFSPKYDKIKNKNNLICMKPSKGIYASGFKLILENVDIFEKIQNNKDKYIISKKYLETILPKTFEEIILIEYINGDEFSYDVFCDNGKIIFGTIRQKHKEQSDFQTIVKNKFIKKVTKKIVKKMNLSNFINFQFISKKTGEIYILEINPRMSGGIPQCNISGINYSELLIDYLDNKNIDKKLKKQNFNIKVGSKRKYIKLD